MISLFAAEERTAKRDRLGDPLKVLDQAIDFGAMARAVDAKLEIGDSGRGGRPPYPTELMIRLLVVQQMYNLSDDALEYQVLDRASFQRFAGLEKSGRVPDAKTVWVWLERLKTQDLIGDISEAVGLQLAQAGFIARGGQIIDASIVTAPVQHNRSEENEAIKRSETPEGWNDAKRDKASICFDSSIEEILAPLICGAQLIAARPHGEYEVAYLAELIERQAVTCIDLTPSLLDALMDMSSPQAWRSIRLVISGGEVLKPELAARFAAKYPSILLNTYGPTEATVQAAWTSELGGSERVAIGRPVANTQLYVLDASMHLVPVGAHGELYIGGAGIAREYLHGAAVTAEKFVPNPFGQGGERLYRTGDQVRWRENGQLEFIGRVDHQVKLRGYRIELSEIEQALEAHPHVGKAVVVLREDQPGLPQLAAYVVVDESISFPDLRESLRDRLPRHMVPALWTRIAQLPLNANGKIDRKRLPSPDAGIASSDHVAPRTRLEADICGIFQDLMQWSRVSIHDNFFDLGGHSLSATRVASRLSTLLGQSLPARLLFEAPTVARLAEATERYLAIADSASMTPEAVTRSLGTEQLMASIEALSEDEIELLLEQLNQGTSP